MYPSLHVEISISCQLFLWRTFTNIGHILSNRIFLDPKRNISSLFFHKISSFAYFDKNVKTMKKQLSTEIKITSRTRRMAATLGLGEGGDRMWWVYGELELTEAVASARLL